MYVGVGFVVGGCGICCMLSYWYGLVDVDNGV